MHTHFHVARIARFTIMSTLMSVSLTCSSVTLAHTNEWVKIESGTLSWLRAIHFANDNVGWIGGSSGLLLKTYNGGQTWKKQSSPTKDNILDIHFADQKTGWILCERDRFSGDFASPSYILKSLDGGETWRREEVEDGPERMLRLVANSDGHVKTVVGEMGTILHILDGSTKFSRKRLTTRRILTSGRMLDSVRGALVGGAGTVLFTDDGGITWESSSSLNSIFSGKLNSVYFSGQELGWVVGDSGRIFHTRNGGLKWTSQSSGVDIDLTDIVFLNGLSGIALGERGTILGTTDGGQNWHSERSHLAHRLERIWYANGRLLIVGFGGTIIARNAK